VEIDVIVPLLQINSETKKEHHAACSILQPHSILWLKVDIPERQIYVCSAPDRGHSPPIPKPKEV